MKHNFNNLYIGYIIQLIESNQSEKIEGYLNNLELWGVKGLYLIEYEMIIFLIENRQLELAKFYFNKFRKNIYNSKKISRKKINIKIKKNLNFT